MMSAKPLKRQQIVVKLRYYRTRRYQRVNTCCMIGEFASWQTRLLARSLQLKPIDPVDCVQMGIAPLNLERNTEKKVLTFRTSFETVNKVDATSW